jgi:hypothetical protein
LADDQRPAGAVQGVDQALWARLADGSGDGEDHPCRRLRNDQALAANGQGRDHRHERRRPEAPVAGRFSAIASSPTQDPDDRAEQKARRSTPVRHARH